MVKPEYLERRRTELEKDEFQIKMGLFHAAGLLAGDSHTGPAAAVLIALDRLFPRHNLAVDGWRSTEAAR